MTNYLEEEQAIPSGLFGTARFALRNYGLLGTLARYLLMQDGFRQFVRRGRDAGERAHRRNLLKQFARIQSEVTCGHSPYQFVLIADLILDLEVEGPIVECGAYKGGGTAKLSLLARQTGRHLYVCDSFAGLPAPRDGEEACVEGHGDTFGAHFAQGQYEGTLDEVRANVEQFGSSEVCEYVPGFFEDSLPALDVKPALVFIDVDLISSALDCLENLWPRLEPGGLWLTHEASFPRYVEGLLDPNWWREHLDDDPPVMFGAGSGLSPLATALGYFRKR